MAREDHSGNASFNKSCSFFLGKLKPTEFNINVPEKDRVPGNFSKDTIEIIINKDIEQVWKGYLALDMEKLLETPKSEVCRVHVPGKNRNQKGLIEGMRFFVDMVFESPIPMIPTNYSMSAMEVLKVSKESRKIEMVYLEGTPSKGWQTIQLEPQGTKTKIVHHAYYKGNSNLIHTLYPPVHRMIWNEIHLKAKNSIEKNK